MATPQIQNNFRFRKSFAKIQKIIDIPNLINIQKQSYDKFLQADVAPEKREDLGLQGPVAYAYLSAAADFQRPPARLAA